MKHPISLVYAFLLTLTFNTYAMDGELTFVSGDARVKLYGIEKKAAIGQILHPGDSIQTLDQTVVIVTLSDQSIVKLNSNSNISLGEGSDSHGIRLNQGGLFAKVQKRTTRDRFFIKTKAAVLGVRGTQFFTSFGKAAESTTPDLWMCVNEGQVEVETLTQDEPKKKVLVNPGEGIFIQDAHKLTPPRAYAWTRSLNWNMDPKSGKVESDSSINSAYKNLLEQDYD